VCVLWLLLLSLLTIIVVTTIQQESLSFNIRSQFKMEPIFCYLPYTERYKLIHHWTIYMFIIFYKYYFKSTSPYLYTHTHRIIIIILSSHQHSPIPNRSRSNLTRRGNTHFRTGFFFALPFFITLYRADSLGETP